MKSFQDYITEAEEALGSPQCGDNIDLDLSAGCLIETYVLESDDDSITVYVDEAAYQALEESGYIGETIRRYGAVGHSPAMGNTLEEEEVEEGRMSDIDVERQDYENLDPLSFRNRYHMGKDEWYAQHKSLLEPKQSDDKAHWDFGRVLELAGCSKIEEDQDAEVVAGKELAADISDPMPGVHEDAMAEAEYQGREVPLNKPMAGDVKKSKVYVKDPKTGNVKKVNFGDPNMRIKKSNPERRKSFRARHHCDNPGPKTKARFWSCRAW